MAAEVDNLSAAATLLPHLAKTSPEKETVHLGSKRAMLMLAIMVAAMAIWHFLFWPRRSSIYTPEEWERCASEGVQAMNRGDLDRAEDIFKQAQNWIRNSPPDDLRRGTLPLDLGQIEGLRHHLAEAEGLLRGSIKIFDAHLDGSGPQNSIALEDLAICEAARNELSQSLNHFQRSIALEQNEGGTNSPRLAKLLREYAGILLAHGQFQASTRSIARATDIENADSENRYSATFPSTESAAK